jgi:hypothetical protein
MRQSRQIGRGRTIVQTDNKRSGTGIITMTAKGSGMHTGNRVMSRRVLTIRTIRWEIIA